MEVTDKQMIESAKLIKKGCKERECDGKCPFFDLDGCGDCSLVDDNIPDCWFIPSLNTKLSDAEKAILGSIDNKYKWIARDEDGEVYVYVSDGRPYKKDCIWSNGRDYENIGYLFPNLFQWCKWKDEEPWYIPDLLKEE